MTEQYNWFAETKWFSMNFVLINFFVEILRLTFYFNKCENILEYNPNNGLLRRITAEMHKYYKTSFHITYLLHFFGLFFICFDFYYLLQIFAIVLTAKYIVLMFYIRNDVFINFILKAGLVILRAITLSLLWIYLSYWRSLQENDANIDYLTYGHLLKYFFLFIISYAAIFGNAWIIGHFIDKHEYD